MINDATVKSVSSIADSLTSENILLRAVEGTPLGNMVTAAAQPELKNTDGTTETTDRNLQAASSVNDLNGVPIYDSIKSTTVDLVSTGLLSSIDVARNTVNPMIEEFTKCADKAVERSHESCQGYEIATVFTPDILTGGVLDELTKKYADSDFIEMAWPENAWPAMEAADIRSAIVPPVARLEGSVKSLQDHLTDEAVVFIYDYLFRNRPMPVSLDHVFTDYTSVVGFLLACRWLGELPENISMSMADVEKGLTDLKASTGRRIQSVLSSNEVRLSQGVFIRNVNKENKVISVWGEVYKKWLDNGGTPELLIGAVLSNDRPPFNMDERIKKQYMAQYSQDRRLREASINNRVSSVITVAAKEYLCERIDDMDIDDKQNIKVRLNDHLKNHPYRKGMCQNKWIRMAICKSIFPKTNALQILETIDAISASEETTPIREVATLASIELLSEWLVDSMVVEDGH